MTAEEFIQKMQDIHQHLVKYLDSEENIDSNFDNFKKVIEDQMIRSNNYEFKSFLHMMVKITNNHHQTLDFFTKISEIIKYFRAEFNNYYSNDELFSIFKENKKILLILINEKILNFTKNISDIIDNDIYFTSHRYNQYFFPEMKRFFSLEHLEKEFQNGFPVNFEEQRQNNLNENRLFEIIQKDSLDEFITYTTENNLSLDNKLEGSLFETNYFLDNYFDHQIINLAAFYGSIQIFNYLRSKDIQLEPESMKYAIHGNNLEIIQNIENNLVIDDEIVKQSLEESIKCHNNDIVKYFMDKYKEQIEKIKYDYKSKSLKYYNFEFIDENLINKKNFVKLAKFDYIYFVDLLLKDGDIDINQVIIEKGKSEFSRKRILSFQILNEISIEFFS